MKFLFSSDLFWGGLLMLIGVSMIIKTLFGIDIPVIRTAAAIFLMYLGFSMITGLGTPFNKNRQTISFDHRTLKPKKLDNEYAVSFGKGIVDLSQIEHPQKTESIIVKTHFGETVLKIAKDVPTRIHAHVTFGKTTFPDEQEISGGSYIYTNYSSKQDPLLDIEAYTTFGSLHIKEK